MTPETAAALVLLLQGFLMSDRFENEEKDRMAHKLVALQVDRGQSKERRKIK